MKLRKRCNGTDGVTVLLGIALPQIAEVDVDHGLVLGVLHSLFGCLLTKIREVVAHRDPAGRWRIGAAMDGL